ncbi:hypothetical protein JCM11251_000014 [Rhodosporidiobolus azoricus]
MASEAVPATYALASTDGPPSLPPVGFHVPPTSQALPGFGELDAGFYASTSSAPYPPAVAPPAFNQGSYPPQPLHGLGSFPYPSPGTHSSYPGYPPTPFSGGPPSYSPAAQSHQQYDPFSSLPPPAHATASPTSFPLAPHSTATSVAAGPGEGGHIPPIGRIRCYWVVLSPRLDFVFLDPIMQHHMGEWVENFIGTNLLDWVHPEDRVQLGSDLLPAEEGAEEIKGVEANGVFGSVTRLRYSRLIRILRNLGCAAPPSPPDGHTYAIDKEWLNLDVTTSWIAGDRKGKGKAGGEGGKGGAVLAFFHATEDKDEVSDNDSQNRTEWTNWCGPAVDYPAYLTPLQCEKLVAALERVTNSGGDAVKTGTGTEEAAPSGIEGPPPHVFQILDAHGRPIVTFPRSKRQHEQLGQSGQGEKAEGDSYDVEQFSMLAREVMARPRETFASKTSCTRRYRSKHPVMKDGTLTTIESVVIMYGAITFACFQTGGIYLRQTTTATSPVDSSTGVTSTAGRKGRLSLITNGTHLQYPNAGATANDFALEDVPTTPVVGTPHPNGNGKRLSYGGGGEQNGSNGAAASQSESMSPPSKRFKPALAPAPPSSTSQPQQPLSGLSIMTGGRLFRNTLDVEAITAGGISPTVASASAILGSFSADAHQLAQQHQQQQQTQQQPQQHFSPNVTNSPSSGQQTSYSAFYNSQPYPQQQPPTSFSSFNPPTISYSHSGQPTPPIYGHSAPIYSPHPLSQAHSAPSYFSPAPVSPHDPSIGGTSPYPPIATSQPFSSSDPTAPSAPDFASGTPGLSTPLSENPPPFSSSASSGASSATAPAIPAILDPSQIPVPPPPPPHSQSGKKPPKQRPDGPVFKPNVKACESCGTVNSPEWRKGPTGAKSLCNACGLRYARSVARQKKQAEAAANGGVAAKGKGKKKAGKAAAAAAALADKGAKNDGSPEGSSTPSLPPHSQPSPIHTSLPGGYDLSAYARASPKPYTPYHTTAPAYPSSFAPASHSPNTSQPSPFHSPHPPTTSSAYFPAMAYSTAPSFSGAPLPMPVATHSPLPPPPNYGDYSRSVSFSASSAATHAPHLPGLSAAHFSAPPHSVPLPHLHSPHLEHPSQHSPLEPHPNAGMFRTASQGSMHQQQQPSYQAYE